MITLDIWRTEKRLLYMLMRRAATRKIASGVVVHRPSCVDPRPFAA